MIFNNHQPSMQGWDSPVALHVGLSGVTPTVSWGSPQTSLSLSLFFCKMETRVIMVSKCHNSKQRVHDWAIHSELSTDVKRSVGFCVLFPPLCLSVFSKFFIMIICILTPQKKEGKEEKEETAGRTMANVPPKILVNSHYQVPQWKHSWEESKLCQAYCPSPRTRSREIMTLLLLSQITGLVHWSTW